MSEGSDHFEVVVRLIANAVFSQDLGDVDHAIDLVLRLLIVAITLRYGQVSLTLK